jgi:cytochrome P450
MTAMDQNEGQDSMTVRVDDQASAAYHLSMYEDLLFVLRSREFVPLNQNSGFNHEYQMMFTGGALIDLYGEDHFERRRLLSALFRRATLGEYENDYLAPAVRRVISTLQASGAEERPIDLLQMTYRIMMRLMVRLVGVDGLETPEAEDRFAAYFRDFDRGARSRYNTDPGPVAARGLIARQKMIEEFIDPSFARRRLLLADVVTGIATEDSLPRDVLTLLLRHEDYYSRQVGDRARKVMNSEVSAFMMASIGSTSNALCGAVYEIDGWINSHPDDVAKLEDPGFLRRCFMEAARLHQTNVMMRQAVTDVTLPTGIWVPAGGVVIMHRVEAGIELASRSTSAGEGRRFDPNRTIEGAAPYVFGFGQGPHMCLGRQMVLGGDYGDDDAPPVRDPRLGVAVTVLGELYRAGIRLTPDSAPSIADDTARETWTRFPVLFENA